MIKSRAHLSVCDYAWIQAGSGPGSPGPCCCFGMDSDDLLEWGDPEVNGIKLQDDHRLYRQKSIATDYIEQPFYLWL